jgi:pimeloyl-ACP methyl ester carboxylesterase
VILGLVATLTGCTDGPPPRSAQPAPGPSASVAWEDCTDEARGVNRQFPDSFTAECGQVVVPRDWNDPDNGETFEIAVMRIRSEDQRDRLGAILTNFGGPGASGFDQLPHLAPDLERLATRFDLVTFDPRGVGQSASVKCIANEDLDASFGYPPDPVSDAEFQGAVAISRRIGEGCGAKFGDQLTLYSTEQAARDMDAVRAAVGDEKLTYLGYSYGTLLGATYAQLFPNKIRALVLDGAVDPGQDIVAGSESQAKGFERAFTNFSNWCAQTSGRCPIGPDARGAVTDALEKARVSPVRGSDGREATAGWVFYAVISSLYTEQGWQELATAIDDLQGGDPAAVFELADEYATRDGNGHYSNLFDANLAVNCADSTVKPTLAQIRSYQSQWRAKYPLFGAPLAVGMLPCAYWPGERDPYPTGEAKGAPPILVVGTTGDPATPYEQTAELADMLGVGVVLTWEGEGHTAYPQTECVTQAVDRYLIDLEAPPAGKRCPG